VALTFNQIQDDEKKIRETASRFSDEHLRPFAIEDDEKCRFRREAFNRAAQLGLVSLVTPKAYGGAEQSYRCYYACLEELARGSTSMGVMVGVTNLVQGGLIAFGSEEQKQRWLKPLASGEYLGAFSLSEPGAGSDAAGLRCAARKASGGYRLNGTKVWCSNGGMADLYLVMARTSDDRSRGVSAFLVPSASEGFRVGKQEKKMGFRASTLAELIFEDCFVPEANRLGNEGDGLAVALSQLDSGRIAIGAAGCGLAIEALEKAWNNARENSTSQPGEGMDQRLAGHYAQIFALRCLIGEAAERKDAREKISALASSIKLLGSDLAMQVTGDAVDYLGYAGGLRQNEVERFFRDAKALQIVEGTNQIQRVVLAREMGKMLPGI